jgi:hypothetical protein
MILQNKKGVLMTICGGCGLAGVRDNHWNPPDHRCPRWNYEYIALRRLRDTVAAFLDRRNGVITEQHVRMVLEACEEAGQRVKEAV